MFVMSDDLGEELREAQSLLRGSIRGQDRLRFLADHYRAYFGAEGDLNEQKRQEVTVAERSAVTASRA